MRVLFVTSRSPYPLTRGDQVVAYHHLRSLGRRHAITLVSLYGDEGELAGLESMAGACDRVVPVRASRLRSFAGVLAATPRRDLPLQVAHFRTPGLARSIARELATGAFDLAHGVMLRVAPYLEPLPLPRTLDLTDSLQLRYERHVGVERPPLRWVYREELRRIRRYETHVASAFDHLTVVSEVDRRYLPSRNVTVVPLGVDADVFRPLPALRRPAPTVVFSGRLGYAPNADAAVWLVEEILPRIHAARPDVQLVLAGADPSAPVRALARRPGVVLTGRVSSMPHALNVATVAVAPLRSGSGMQNKVLEAMACALPVVTTHRAFEGIQGQPGRDLIVADSPTQIADAVVALLADPARAESIGQAARETVRRHHSWEASAARLEEIWQAVASGANE